MTISILIEEYRVEVSQGHIGTESKLEARATLELFLLIHRKEQFNHATVFEIIVCAMTHCRFGTLR